MGQNFSSEPVVEKETERDHNDIFNVAVSSCQGWRMSQEDNHSLILELPGEHKAAFFAVYDGHGSARVSKHASEGLWRHLVENDAYIKGNFKEALEASFLTFDREVNESYNAQLAGTTAVSLLIVNNTIYCANIGDSRGVACVNCECIPLSYDHKPENPLELKRILAAGGYVLGNRVNGNLALSRAFGDFHYKNNEQLPPEQQIVSPCPDVKTIDLNDDVDFLLLACDGIWDVLSSEEVVEFVISRLEQNMEPGLICEQLTTRCLATDYELVIGCDNMTVLLICYTRGRSWVDFCTDIFNKNTSKLGEPDRARRLYDPTTATTSTTTNTAAATSTTTATNTRPSEEGGETEKAPGQVFYDLLDVWKSTGAVDPTAAAIVAAAAKESTSRSTSKEEHMTDDQRGEDGDKQSAETSTSGQCESDTTETVSPTTSTDQTADGDDVRPPKSEEEVGEQVEEEVERQTEEEKEQPKCSIKALRDNKEVGDEKSCLKADSEGVAQEEKAGEEKETEGEGIDRCSAKLDDTPEANAGGEANQQVEEGREEVEEVGVGESEQVDAATTTSTSSSELGVEA